MKNLVTKRYKGYTYHIDARGDYYIACKKFKGLYIGFPAGYDPKMPIQQLVDGEIDEVWLLKISREQMLRVAEACAKETKYVKTY